MDVRMFHFTLYGASLVACLLLLTGVTESRAETEYFPGLRKPPPARHWNPDRQTENAYMMARINSFIEEETRRRFQQQAERQRLQQQQQYITSPWSKPAQEIAVPGFTYQFPVGKVVIAAPSGGGTAQTIPFAVSPNDPRYYEASETGESFGQQMTADLDQNYQERPDDYGSPVNVDGLMAGSSIKIKSPMEVRPKENAIINNGQYLQRSEVIKKHMDLNTVDMYVVAIIAGVSATLTVGLIAIGIAWYTLHKKGLAAADVDYPAYGVTGPNKEISPSGDRRLAQSAQMYHYQHQKQQIIGMERASNEHRNGSLTDVESDEENEEGDYTVYECPGLAPTGEMEVKNPLFLDDPTPATPATGLDPEKGVAQPKLATAKPLNTNHNNK